MTKEMDDLRKTFQEKAKDALDKTPIYGPDIDLSRFQGREIEKVKIDLANSQVARKLETVGIDVTEKSRVGSYYQVDNIVINELSKHPGVEILSLEEAFEEFGKDLLDYYWRAVPVDRDKFTAAVELIGKGGYVIWVKKNVKVPYPIQTCLMVFSDDIIQAPHNIIIVEPGSEVTVITGCLVMREALALHAGVSEFYVGENAKVTFIMIHGWNKNMHVRPRTGAIIENNGVFISHYINMAPVASLQTYPVVKLLGDNSRCHLSTVIVGRENAIIDVGGESILSGDDSKSEIISRVIGRDYAKITARGQIVGNANNVKGHLECRGLLLSENAEITTVPVLASNKLNIELTHEASIGKLAEDEILYLMARGFSKEEAEALLVRGFMKVDIEGIPENLKKMIDKTIEILSKQAL